MVCGHAKIRSRATLERQQIMFGVVHMGDHNVSAGVKVFVNKEGYQALQEEMTAAFRRADFHETLRVLDRHFGTSIYSIKDLFKDEKKRITDLIMSEAMAETEERFGRLYQNNYPLMSYLASVHEPIPKVFGGIAEFVENRGLRKTLLAEGRIDTEKIRGYLLEAQNWGIKIDSEVFALDLSQVLEKKMNSFEKDGGSISRLEEILDLLALETQFPMGTNLGGIQNSFFLWLKGRKTSSGETSPRFEELVEQLGRKLQVKLPERPQERSLYA